MRLSLEQRFWAKVNKTDGCWLWTGARTPRGYGKLGLGSRREGNIYAHRYSYQLHIGPIPEKMEICHHCDNPSCCTPAHLFLGTHADNMADRNRKGRARGGCTKGRTFIGRPKKLSAEQVRHMLTLYAAGAHSIGELARMFSVDQSTASKIVNRKIWKHIETPPGR